MSERNSLGIFYNPWKSSYDHKQSIQELYGRAIWLKANPRSEEYMRSLFAERWPNGVFVDIHSNSDWQSLVKSADNVVLLYPDAIGIKFTDIETTVNALKKEWAAIRVLNGRRRDFLLNRAVRFQLRLRRFIERSMLGEVFIMIFFITISPFFLVSDFLGGKR